jgi:hypothetical protein
MPSPAALRFIAAGFLMSLLIWSLLPDAADHLVRSEWAEVPSDFRSDAEGSGARAQRGTETDADEWMRATGERNPAIDRLIQSQGPAE